MKTQQQLIDRDIERWLNEGGRDLEPRPDSRQRKRERDGGERTRHETDARAKPSVV